MSISANRYRFPAVIGVIVCFVFTLACGSGQKKQDGYGVVYTCPMHPEIIKDEMGRCPICKMDLVPVRHTDGADSVTIGMLLQPTNSVVVSNVGTVKPFTSSPQFSTKLNGVIAYDERLINTVSARVDGRIEKLYVKYPYQRISRGQRLFDLYSPELRNQQHDYIFLLKKEGNDAEIVRSAQRKLELSGLNESQITQIEREMKVIDPLPYFSPYEGHLHSTNAAGSIAEMRGGMPDGSEEQGLPGSTLAKEGMYVKKGQTIFRIYSTERVWGLFNLDLKDASLMKEGDAIEVKINGEMIRAHVDFIEPVIRGGQNFVSVRVYLNNDGGRLKIGQNVTGVVRSSAVESLFLPTASVISLGLRKVVFVKEGIAYKAREVKTGGQSGEWIEVRGGVDTSSMVAKDAQYLIDSESFIKLDE